MPNSRYGQSLAKSKILSRYVFSASARMRHWLTIRKIDSESKRSWATILPSKIDEVRRLEILPLFEAGLDGDYCGGAGVSYLIRADRYTILFDLGDNPLALTPSPLEQNMARMGISLEQIDAIFISHRHPDHVGGRKWWAQRTFSITGSAQPELGALKVYSCERMSYPESKPIQAKTSMRISAGVMTTGPFSFFEPYPSFQITPNYYEHALIVNISKIGLIIITGCGHMGLRALIERTKANFAIPLAGVIGGLHYTNKNKDSLEADIKLIHEQNLRIVALSAHDSGAAAIEAFSNSFPTAYRPLLVGRSIIIEA